MKSKVRFKGQIKTYIMWPVWMSGLVALFTVIMFFVNTKAGFFALAFAIIYAGVAFFFYYRDRGRVINDLVSFATQYGQVQRQLLRELEIPYALMDETGKIIWTNDAFEETLHVKKGFNKNISSIIPEITREKLPRMEHETESIVVVEERDYRASMKKVSMAALASATDTVEMVDYDSYLVALYMFDVTEVSALTRQIDEQKMVCGLVYIDNYDETLESVEEVRRSLLVALIDRQINKYFSKMDTVIKKLEKDKFLVVMRKKELKEMVENRFEILEEIKNVNIGNELAVTLSIGFGVDSDSFLQNYEYARTAIDLALGRGGDQAVIKNEEEISYYGGKREMTGRNTRVKARVKAHALKEIVEGSDMVIIMGHKILDVDAFGASIGIYRVAKTLGKKAHIVVDEITSSIRPMIDIIRMNEAHEDNLFVSCADARKIAETSEATLVVVDVNKPSFTGCPELLDICQTVVVLDHHRQGTEKIENATLSYIEPYASSASEMVSEILQYTSDHVKLLSEEADCLYAGMMIDTNNFMTKTGVRTFEAAAYLRRYGADVTRVRKLFRDDFESYKARAEIVRNADVFDDSFAVAITPESITDSPTIVGAQAANELLNINGIKASFVLTMHQGEVFISARSIDEINVQLIMERLGGGGHMNVAGAQIKDKTMDEAKALLVSTIRDMKNKGEI